MRGGFIKLWRSMLDSAVMKDDWLCRLWLWCLFKAQWQQVDREGSPDRGQFYTGRITGSGELGVSPSKWYRGIERLSELGCIEVKADSNRTTITVCNYATYQDSVEESEQIADSKRTANEQQVNNLHCNIKKERRKEGATQAFDPLSPHLPAALDSPAFLRVWRDLIAYRVGRRLSAREGWCTNQLKNLASFGESVAIQAIENSILNHYQGIFPEKFAAKQFGHKINLTDAARDMADWAESKEPK